MESMSIVEPLPAESFRAELLGYCYRFFGSYPEAEDAVQETMLRAWQHGERFEARSSLRTWLYRIATHVCLDMKRSPQRRALPVDLSAPGGIPADPATLTTRPAQEWVGPIADAWLDQGADPGEVAVRRDSIRLAFVAALQLLPPRQRVVLILRDVLAFSAAECADLLDLTVPSVNSALARARRTLATRAPAADPMAGDGPAEEKLLQSYVTAFEAYDVDALVRLLTEDAVFSMPPFELWLRGATEIEAWWRGPGQVCRGSRTRTTRANGPPAMAVYHPVGAGRWEPFALQVVDMRGERISGLTHFMGAAVFAEFGLPGELHAPAEKDFSPPPISS
jgi:RNA polymerase sigma-70 factor (ECF subfamily)